jgi:general secretion pathway protein E
MTTDHLTPAGARPVARDIVRRLGDLLIEHAGITAAHIEHALAARTDPRERIGQALVRLGFVDDDAVVRALARQFSLPVADADKLAAANREAVEKVPEQLARASRVLPLAVQGSLLDVAVADPLDVVSLDHLRALTGCTLRAWVARPSELDEAIDQFYSELRATEHLGEILDTIDVTAARADEQEVDLAALRQQVVDAPVVRLVNLMIAEAIDQRASDIHVEPRREVGVLRFRIDGVLHDVYQMPFAVLAAMTARIKILGRMDVVEKRRPQDGRIKTRMPDGTEIELRLSTLPTAHGEKVVMRIFDPEVLMRDFKDLGFTQEEHEIWQNLTQQPGGILLVTGPTGSGKTTTLYTTLKQIATSEVNVCTIEDPIEMIDPRLNQMQVQPEIDLTFANGVRALMRQDPDIIMVGEIRDFETADMAIQAALTGHLVLSTLHTNDAPSSITRLLDLGAPAYLLNSTLLGIMAQRLVRTLCPHCKEKVPFNREDEHRLWYSVCAPFKAPPPAEVYRPVGCLECRNTGYMGRIGIYEIMQMTRDTKHLINEKTDLVALTQAAYKGGMRPLRVSGATKVAQGLTTFEEVLKSAPHA